MSRNKSDTPLADSIFKSVLDGIPERQYKEVQDLERRFKALQAAQAELLKTQRKIRRAVQHAHTIIIAKEMEESDLELGATAHKSVKHWLGEALSMLPKNNTPRRNQDE